MLATILAVILSGATSSIGEDPSLAANLRAYDQALLAAVHTGDRTLWARTTAPDFIYVEEGGVQRRDVFLNGLKPDGGGALQIRDFELHQFGDTAAVLHYDLAPPDPTDARSRQPQLYVMSETWTRMQGEWRLHLVHVDAIKTAPPALSLTSAQLDELAGCYRRGTSRRVISHVGDHLVLQKQGEPDKIINPETQDVFFDPAELRGRYVFQRDRLGRVTGFVVRYENADSIWTR